VTKNKEHYLYKALKLKNIKYTHKSQCLYLQTAIFYSTFNLLVSAGVSAMSRKWTVEYLRSPGALVLNTLPHIDRSSIFVITCELFLITSVPLEDNKRLVIEFDLLQIQLGRSIGGGMIKIHKGKMFIKHEVESTGSVKVYQDSTGSFILRIEGGLWTVEEEEMIISIETVES
jgi:hypothetical protein